MNHPTLIGASPTGGRALACTAMSDADTPTALDRLWRRLEARYGTQEFSCDCLDGDGSIEVLEDTALTRRHLEAYRAGDRSMAELVDALDEPVDPSAVDGLADLAARLDGLATDAADGAP